MARQTIDWFALDWFHSAEQSPVNCRCCDSEPQVLTYREGNQVTAWVRCPCCGACGPHEVGGDATVQKFDAVAGWNRMMEVGG